MSIRQVVAGLVRDVFSGTTIGSRFRRRRRSNVNDSHRPSEILEARCLLTGGVGQFLEGDFLGDQAAADVALGDVDGDGDLDAFLAHLDTSGGDSPADWTGAPNRLYINDGDGFFTDSGQLLGNGTSISVDLRDLNGDGHLDAFVGNSGPNSVWLNDGSGNFTDSGLALGNGFSIGVEIGSLNGDAVMDVAVTNNGDIVPGLNGDGEVWIAQSASPLQYVNTGSSLWGTGSTSEIALGDVDGNGTVDAVVTEFSSDDENNNVVPGTNRVFLNNGTGTFTESGNLGSMGAFGVDLADFDGDGDLDAYIADNDELGDRVYINQGGAQSGTEGQFTDSGQRLGPGAGTERVAIDDLDGDGDPDVFVTRDGLGNSSPEVSVFINQGGIQGGTAGEFANNGQTIGSGDSLGVALGDVDGNGTIDAVVADLDGFSQVWLNSEFPIFTYSANGNVSIDVPATDGLLAGAPAGVQIDTFDDFDTFGTVDVYLDGSFEYTPETGYFGTDTFSVDWTNGETRTVVIDVGDAFWFVDEFAAPGGDGSLAAPFQSLAPLNDDGNDPDFPWDLIHINGDGFYDVDSADGFILEFGQNLVTSHVNPFANPVWLSNIGHPLAEFSVGLPTTSTARPELSNSAAGGTGPVVEVSGDNFLSGFDIDPIGAAEAVLGFEADGWVSLHGIDVIPSAGSHSYDGVALYDSDVHLGLYDFQMWNFEDSTTSGTSFYIDGGEFSLDARANTFVGQRGGGVLHVTNTTGNGEVVFHPDTTLWIDGGDYGFHLENNPNLAFGFDGNFVLNEVANGITAISSGTIEMPQDAVPAERDVDGHGGFALRVEHTSTGVDGWHLDQVNSSGGTGAILLDDVGGGGIHINQTEIGSHSGVALDVSDTPNTIFDFGQLLIMGDDVIVDTAIGTGVAGSAGDGGLADGALVNLPSDVVFDNIGNLYFSDFAEHVVRRVDAITGVVTTIAGNGSTGFSGDGGAATSAQLNGPGSVAVDRDGHVFIADTLNSRIRRVDAATGVISTVAGNGTAGFGGDGGPADSAMLHNPVGLALDDDGNVFIADEKNHAVRRIDADTGVINTVVGTGSEGAGTDGTAPQSYQLNGPFRLAFAASGNLLITDSGNARVVQVDWQANEVHTLVGTGTHGNNGTDGNDPLSFQLSDPRGIAIFPDGGLLITDHGNHRIVAWWGEDDVEVVSGTGVAGFAGDGGSIDGAQYNEPVGIAVSPAGDVFVTDVENHRVRKLELDLNPGDGVILENNPGSTFIFDTLNVRATGEAFVAVNSGHVVIRDDNPLSGVNATLVAENGVALDIANTHLSNGDGGSARFRNVTSWNSPWDGILLDDVSGDIVVESGMIADANQNEEPFTAGIAIEGGQGNVTIYSTIVNSKRKSVAVSGRTGGDIHLVTPIHHTATGQSPVVVENNVEGSTTFYRPINASGDAAGNVVQNNSNHVVTFLTDGFPPDDDDDVRVFDVSPFERLETLGSLVSISGTDVDVVAGETIEFEVELEEDQLLSGVVDSSGGSSLANLTVEIVGVTGALTAEEIVVLPPQSIETSGTYIVRVTSDAAVTTELFLILNAALEIPDSSDGNELAIDLSDIGGPASLGAVVAITEGSTTVPDVDEFTIDLTGLAGESIDVVLTGFEDHHYENQTLELLAADGTTVLATGTATPVNGINATNLDLAIFDFEVPANGIYTARVTAAFDDVAYTLLVTHGLTFDAEPNNDRINDSLRSITPNNAAQGHLDAATDADDFYEIELTAGQEATLFTDFTFDASVSPVNTLNPDLEIFRPDGTSLISNAAGSIGGIAQVVFTAAETGTYVVRIGATAGSGEYLLHTDVAAPPAVDFGDAPDVAINGPSHTIVPGLFLGVTVDAEAAGRPGSNASGDDADGALPDDEDGVLYPFQELIGTVGAQPQVTVKATNATGTAATLYGWIDYNQDYIFDNATERTQVTVPSGTDGYRFTLTFPAVPEGSNATTYARFRLSTDVAAASATGPASDGEVEDYPFLITTASDVPVTVAGQQKIVDGGGLTGGSLSSSARFGSAMANMGDINGDGIADLAVGAYLDDGMGAAYILFMNVNGTVNDQVRIANGEGGLPAGTLAAGDTFGASVANLGDLNGDGVNDLAVGAFGNNVGGSGYSGAVHVLMMEQDGTVGSHAKLRDGSNGVSVSGNAFFGRSVTGIGDIDGDGVPDMAVGAPGNVFAGGGSGASVPGEVHVLMMNADGSVKDQVLIDGFQLPGGILEDRDMFGRSVTGLGDLDGDGVGDLAVGAYGDSTYDGAVYVLMLTSNGAVRSHVKLEDGAAGVSLAQPVKFFGLSATAVGDLDGDGIVDLAIGSNSNAENDGFDGALHILNMNNNGTVREHSRISRGEAGFVGSSNQLLFGSSVASLGDIDGDGLAKLAVGEQMAFINRGSAGSGAVHILSLAPPPPPLEFDFGDAPDSAQSGFANSYPVTLAENGARHGDSGATLGPNLDLDANGIHSAGAVGDDTNGSPDDEDGVTFVGGAIIASTGSAETGMVTVDLQDPHSVRNRLDAWIDWNQDGDWNDPGEQIFEDYFLGTVAGLQTLTFQVPQDIGTNVVEGTTYSRFRLSSIGELAPTGEAADGEVEDHAVDVTTETPTLTVSIVADSIAENDGLAATTATVTRSGNLDSTLTVTLLSSDTSEATVAGTATILAGQTTSASFDINAVNDSDVDGPQVVTITASATGYSDGTDTVTVDDDDAVNQPPVADAGGPYTITESESLSLDGSGSHDPDGDSLTFRWDVNGDGIFDAVGEQPTFTWGQLQALGISADGSSRPIALQVDDGDATDNDSTTLTVDPLPDGVVVIDFEEFSTGVVTPDFLAAYGVTSITVSAGADLEVFPEFAGSGDELNPGYANYLGQRNPSPFSARTMTFHFDAGLTRFGFRRIGGAGFSSSPKWTATAVNGTGQPISVPFGEPGSGFILLTDPASYELVAPAGESIASFSFHMPPQLSTFGVTPIDDLLLGFDDSLVPPTVDVSLSANTGTEQDQTVITVTATASDAVSGNQTVDLDVSGLGISGGDFTLSNSTITIPDGQTSGSVTFTIVDDSFSEDTETATLTISNPTAGIGLGSTLSDTVSINDNDGPAALTITIDAASIGEADGTAATSATVFRNTDTSEPLTVTLTSSQPGEAGVQSQIVIPAGETTSVPFSIDAIDDSDVDGPQVATITASAAGHSDGTDTVIVTDDDVPNLPPNAGAGGPYTIIEGTSVTLDASDSTDPEDDSLTFRWDIDGDGDFDEGVTGEQPTLTWSQLQTLGFSADSSARTITVEANDGEATDTAQTTLTVHADPPGSTTIDFESIVPATVAPDFLAASGITNITVSAGWPLEVFSEQPPGSSNELNPGFGNYLGQRNPSPFVPRTMTFEFAPGLTRFGFRRIGGSNSSSAPRWTATATNSDGQPIPVPFGEPGGGFFLLRNPETFELTAPEGETIASFTFHMPGQGSTFGVTPIDDLVLEFDPSTPLPPSPVVGDLNYTEDQNGGAAVQIDPAAMLDNAAGVTNWDGATLSLGITENPEASDEISIPDNVIGNINTDGNNLFDGGTMIGTLNAAEGTVSGGSQLTITFNGSTTSEQIEDVLQAISYRTTSDTPNESARIITFTLTDPLGQSTGDTSVISVAANNDPATVSLINVVTSLREDADTSSAIKIADIDVLDPDGGANVVQLVGDDAAFFSLVGTEIFLVANTELVFDTKPTYSLDVMVDDPEVPGTPDHFATLTLDVEDVPDIIDNRDLSFIASGTWTIVNRNGYANGFQFANSGSGENSATWTLPLVPGQYRVAATWTAYSNRATNSPFTVFDGIAPLGTVNVDQTTAPTEITDRGTKFNQLGIFQILSGELNVLITDAANGLVIADAIRVERIGPPIDGPEISVSSNSVGIADDVGVLDFGDVELGSVATRVITVTNTGTEDLVLQEPITLPVGFTLASTFSNTTVTPGTTATFEIQVSTESLLTHSGVLSFQSNDADEGTYNFVLQGTVVPVADSQTLDNGDAGFSTTGSWAAITSKGYDTDFEYTLPDTVTADATWTFDVIPGVYRVSASWIAHSNRATNAPFTILNDAFPLATVVANQRISPSDRVIDGALFHDLGFFQISSEQLAVRLSNLADGLVVADAVQIERIGELAIGPEANVSSDGELIADDTGVLEFGDVEFGNTNIRTVTILNSGTEDLILAPISLPAGFTLAANFGSATVPPGATTSFAVQIDTGTLGSLSGELSFGVNDSDENPFNFTVQGTVVPVSDVQIVDNSGVGFNTAGTWATINRNGHNGGFLIASAGNGSSVATWAFNVIPGGNYRISATWRAYTNRASDAPFTITDGSTALATVHVDQKTAPNDFVSEGSIFEDLGIFSVSGNQLFVELSNLADGLVLADAIRIELIPD